MFDCITSIKSKHLKYHILPLFLLNIEYPFLIDIIFEVEQDFS